MVAEFQFNRYSTESGVVLETGKENQHFVDFREFRNNYCLTEAEAETMRDRRRKEAEKRPPQKVTIEYADGHCKVFVGPWNDAILRYIELQEKISAGSHVRSVTMSMEAVRMLPRSRP